MHVIQICASLLRDPASAIRQPIYPNCVIGWSSEARIIILLAHCCCKD